MKKMEIIDSHAHIYPAKIADKATKAIGDFYNISMEISCGIGETLLKDGKEAGVSRFVVHSCATKSSQVHAINEFIYNEIKAHPEFIGFMTLHQDMTYEEVEKEVLWCLGNGFLGVKLHPDFQKFYIDEESAQKFYQVVEKIGKSFPILFHTGDDRYEYSAPKRLALMAKKYPNVSFIGAHFGGYRRWREVDVYLGLDNVYFDTCSSLAFISKEEALSLIRKFGVDKFFFGTDFPMWNAKQEISRFNELNLTEEEKEKIFSVNLKKLLNIK